MSNVWRYLSSDELVFKVQSAFGVERIDKDDRKKFRVTNKFFHYLFLIGTELGDELFYGIFIPVFFFNVDGFIGRRFVLHWFLNMYVGQALKEVFMVVRPKPPAIQMQEKWSNEFSLPSTHSMGSLSMAGTILYFAIDRYNIDLWLGIMFVVLWVTIISMSRVYLGMHSVADCVLGVVISLVMLMILLPFTEIVEHFFVVSKIAPLFFVLLPVVLIIYFPTTNLWTPTRGDTCVIAAVFSGIEFGMWFNYQFGYLQPVDVAYPIALDFSDYYSIGARTVVGLAIAGLTEFLGKFIIYSSLCVMLNVNKKVLKASENSIDNTTKNFVDLTSKFMTYLALGFNVIVTVPITYKYLNIQRDAFFSEI